jgi:hypothetical protein
MRTMIIARAGAFAGLAVLGGCGRPAPDNASTSVPSRRAGLWEQVLTRDGKPGRLGRLQVCIDTATDARFSAFGRHFSSGQCQRTITRDGAVYRFTASCTQDSGAMVKTTGVATGNFTQTYRVRSDISVSGSSVEAMNGVHAIEINGRYLGPCPNDMRPGDVSLGGGLKVNIDSLPKIAAAMGAN